MSGWQTIESDAGVFTHLIESLGVRNVQFEELLSLDEYSLSSLGKIYGVIFLFRYSPSVMSSTAENPDGVPDYQASENIFFAAQTIQNACGTQAILSILLNQDDTVEIGKELKDFREFTKEFPSEFRGEALSNSELIRSVHNSFARSSPFVDETTREATEDDDLYHFIAYCPINGVLYELDGLQAAPISHGPCTEETFPKRIVEVLQRRISRYPPTEIRFNLMAVVQDSRIRMREFGDTEGLQREEDKREAWRWENSLRKHNFVGFAAEVLKAVVKQKISHGDYDKWIEENVELSKARIEERQKKGGSGEE